MTKVKEMREVEITYCDVCGKDAWRQGNIVHGRTGPNGENHHICGGFANGQPSFWENNWGVGAGKQGERCVDAYERMRREQSANLGFCGAGNTQLHLKFFGHGEIVQ